MRYPILDGFDHYASIWGGAQGGLDTEWNVNTTFIRDGIGLVTGLGGDGKALYLPGGNGYNFSKAFPAVQKITFHFAIQIVYRIAPSFEFIQFMTAAGGHQFGLKVNNAGLLEIRGEGDAVVATSVQALLTNQVYRIALQADMTGGGKIRCSINGTDDAGLHLDGVDIIDDPVSTQMELLYVQDSGHTEFGCILDDFILGIDECVDWGPQEVNTLPANLDVAAAWARSAGANNYANVDDIPFTIDADYNSSSTLGQKDCFAYGDLPHVPESILAVQLMTMARKEESAVRKIREFLRIAAVDYPGDEHNLAETYGRWVSSWIVNPATGLAWTAAEINALQGGYELTVV